ncbi:hypothetical protein QBC35DRAFT_367971, partial [Podospora australis]
MSYAGASNVGFPNIYEGSNQKNVKKSEIDELSKTSGENVKGFMPKNQADAVNRLYEQDIQRKQAEALKKDPTLAAQLHGNRPSRGAMVDKELELEDEETLRKK